MNDVFETLLNEVRRLHENSDALQDFCDFPEQITRQTVAPFHTPAATLMQSDKGLFSDDYTQLRDAFIDATPNAHWRETYKGTHIADEFREKFGCYCLIGGGGPFSDDQMGAFVVYMPKGFYYPFHHHPAEEIYFVIAGEAEFLMQGKPPKTLGPGSHVFHPSNEPHATQTRDHPFMALVLWRGDMNVKPVLTNPVSGP